METIRNKIYQDEKTISLALGLATAIASLAQTGPAYLNPSLPVGTRVKERFTEEQILSAPKTYAGIDAAKLKQHLFYFLQQVVPVAEAEGLKMAIHPDDPPYPVLGLPRIVSTEQDAFFPRPML